MSEVQMSKIMSVPKWDGKGKTFQGWWMQFVTFAALCNFEALIEDEIDPELLSSGTAPLGNDKQGKIKNWAKYQNVVAIAQLAMAFSTDTAMPFLHKGMANQNWPKGVAYLVVKAIKTQYVPNNLILKVELHQKLNAVRMKKNDDPAELFNQISAIKVKSNKPGQAMIEDGGGKRSPSNEICPQTKSVPICYKN